ncbi:MAG: TM1802 family CRISPR-associated protein, partial [bacterium]
MIEAIKNIGKLVYQDNERDRLEGIVVRQPEQPAILVTVNFSIEKGEITLTNLRDFDDKLAKKYLFIPITRGYGTQLALTTEVSKSKYLGLPTKKDENKWPDDVGFSLLNFYKGLPENSELKQRIRDVLRIFFEKVDKTYKLKEQFINNFVDAVKKKEQKVDWKSKKRKINLYLTVAINGDEIVLREEYKEFLKQFESERIKDGVTAGTCGICGNREVLVKILSNRLKFLKFYIEDKKGFAPNLDEDLFHKNFGVCPLCFSYLVAADTYLEQKFQRPITRDLKVLIVPERTIRPLEDKKLEDKKLIEKIKEGFGVLLTWETIEDLEQSIKD